MTNHPAPGSKIAQERPVRAPCGRSPDDLLLLTDKMTMATSLECRVPLLDHLLVERAARIPAGIKVAGGEMKSLMKKLPKRRGRKIPISSRVKTHLYGRRGAIR